MGRVLQNLPLPGAMEAPLPTTALGVGLKPAHYAEILLTRPALDFFEIHAENYMAAGGPDHRWLGALREHYALSLHGVGLSLGSAEKLDRDHVARLVRLERLYRPALVSEHLAWRSFDGAHFPDLLPLPLTEANLRRTAEKIDAVQNALGRVLLIENPATYLRFAGDVLEEPHFLAELAVRSGCGLLLDVNNVHVAAVNHGFDATKYFDAFPLHRVREIHLAGSAETRDAAGALLIDDHGSPVKPEVWALYDHVLRRAGPRPTLIEWDNDVPEFSTLLAEADKAAAHFRAGVEVRPVAGVGAPSERTPTSPEPDWRADQARIAQALRQPDTPAPDLFAPCDAQNRFAIYRNNSAVACREALKTQFPSVLLLIGDDAFEGLARAFYRDHPPHAPVLGDYGEGFAEFVEAAPEVLEQTPYLPDLARLDWACLKTLRAEEAVSADLQALAALDPEKIATLRAKLHPSLRLIESDWPLLALRASAQKPVEDWDGGAILALRPLAELVLVPCPSDAAVFVKSILRGAALGEAAEEAAEEAGQNFDFGACLVELVQLGTIEKFFHEE